MVRLHYGLISLHYSAVSHIVSLISFYDFASYLIRSLNGIQMNLALWISGCAALASGPPDPQSPVITPGFVRVRRHVALLQIQNDSEITFGIASTHSNTPAQPADSLQQIMSRP